MTDEQYHDPDPDRFMPVSIRLSWRDFHYYEQLAEQRGQPLPDLLTSIIADVAEDDRTEEC